MKFQLIRHATVKLSINNFTILIDPMFSPKGSLDAVPNSANSFSNPLVELPCSVDEILQDVDLVVITHLHRDHFDASAMELLPKSLPILCQPADESKLIELQFENVHPIKQRIVWKDIEFIRTDGEHGTGELMKQMGPVSGFIIKADGEPSVYLVGDSVWCSYVQEAITEYTPEIIIVNAGAAQFLTGDPITMDLNDIEQVSLSSPLSHVIAVHMESWNHCLLSKEHLANFINKNRLNNVKVPSNGEQYVL